jgi:uncharacterized linocin/CFP29 family protein
MGIVHVVGPDIDVHGRIVQRCAVCGAKLCDSLGVMIPEGQEYAVWPMGRLVEVEAGNPTSTVLLPEQKHLPANSCEEFI